MRSVYIIFIIIIIIIIIIVSHRQHAVHKLWPIASNVARSMICVPVYLCVWCKNGWTDRDAVWGADSYGSGWPCTRRSPNPPAERVTLGGTFDGPFINLRTHANVPAERTGGRIYSPPRGVTWQDDDAASCQITLDTCY